MNLPLLLHGHVYKYHLISLLFNTHKLNKNTYIQYISMGSVSLFSFIVLSLLVAGIVVCGAIDMNRDLRVTWGDGRAKIVNNGELLSLSLDKASGSGFESKNEYLFGQIDMQIKLVPGNSAGTVTAYYVSLF